MQVGVLLIAYQKDTFIPLEFIKLSYFTYLIVLLYLRNKHESAVKSNNLSSIRSFYQRCKAFPLDLKHIIYLTVLSTNHRSHLIRIKISKFAQCSPHSTESSVCPHHAAAGKALLYPHRRRKLDSHDGSSDQCTLNVWCS